MACVLLATAVRLLFGAAGASLPFATYFPAVLITALLAGVGPGIFAIILSIIVVWWAFVGAPFAFEAPTGAEALNGALFAFAAALIVWLAARYRGVVRDLRQNEKARELIMKELEHRGKNTFAVVEAIVRRSLHGHDKLSEEIVGRIRSVSSTNDIINRSDSRTATLDSVFINELAPYGSERLSLSGLPVDLSADTARNMALVAHEMVTNAAKYGALSVPQGRIALEWSCDGDRVSLDWREHGGPPAVAPSTYGFGSRLIVRTINAMQGVVQPTFSDDGFSLHLTFQNE